MHIPASVEAGSIVVRFAGANKFSPSHAAAVLHAGGLTAKKAPETGFADLPAKPGTFC